jgi:sugar phosphate isomerase/epimerase
MAVVHAKDLRISDGNPVTCPVGSGMIDYPLLLSWLARHKPGLAVVLEEVPNDQVAACRRFLLNQSLSPIS